MLTEISVAVSIVAVCLLLHVAGIMVMGRMLLQRRDFFEQRSAVIHDSLIIIVLFFCILLLHLSETAIWALFYYSRGLFRDFESALYFSMTSYTTIGYGDILLPERWRLLGAIEGVSGVLLCGVSTAFIFAVLNGIFQFRIARQNVE